MCGSSGIGSATSVIATNSKLADQLRELIGQMASSDGGNSTSQTQKPTIDDGASLDVSG